MKFVRIVKVAYNFSTLKLGFEIIIYLFIYPYFFFLQTKIGYPNLGNTYMYIFLKIYDVSLPASGFQLPDIEFRIFAY